MALSLRPLPNTQDYRDRIEYELGVLDQLGFSDYMLLVADIVDWARQQSIRVGPGRGSVGGSLVAYALKITEINPLEYGLPFERFLNPARVSPPDIDLDFAEDGRDRVIRYVEDKYGKEYVAAIGTVGTFGSRSAVMFASKALELPEDDARVTQVAERIDGMARLTGRHAAGVCISPIPLFGNVPMVRSRGAESAHLTTQWDKEDLDVMGFLKVDCLGVSRLATIQRTVDAVQYYRGISLDMATIPKDDRGVLERFKRADVQGVFQFDTPGSKRLLKQLQPESLYELAVATALDRPATLNTGVVDTYVKRKRGQEPVEFLHPSLEKVLAKTYGIAVFQEQLMQVAVEAAGFSQAEADVLRHAIGKKKPEEMAKQHDKFFDKARALGVDDATVDEIWRWLEAAAGYQFNMAHSVAYATLAYQTAWLRLHYPLEWYTALLNEFRGNPEKLKATLADAKRHGIAVLAPDVRRCSAEFSIASDGKSIAYGLSAIPNVGENACVAIHQGFQRSRIESLEDLLLACDMGKVNTKVMEALAQAGALREFGSPQQLAEALPNIFADVREQKRTAQNWADGKRPRWMKVVKASAPKKRKIEVQLSLEFM